MIRSKKYIRDFLYSHHIFDYLINNDNSVDIFQNVDLSNTKLVFLPINFRNIYGNFYVFNNKLLSLYGAPLYVEKNFNVSCNLLTSLRGSPKIVGGICNISNNLLTSLIHCPNEIKGDFLLKSNNIKTFDGVVSANGGDVLCDFIHPDKAKDTLSNYIAYNSCVSDVSNFSCNKIRKRSRL